MRDQSEIIDYLLGELDELERARFERGMQEDAELRAEVGRMSLVVGRLEDLSGEAWDYAGAHRDQLSSAPEHRERRAWFTPRRAGFAFGAAAVLAGILIVLLTARSTTAPTKTVVLTAVEGAPARSHATATITGSERVQVNVEHLTPTDRLHYYELWLMTDATHLVPVASFRVNGRGTARLSLPLPASPAAYRYLNISLQNARAGSAISSLSVLRGPT